MSARKAFLLGILAAAFVSTLVSVDNISAYTPPSDYQSQLLEVGDPSDWEDWRHAIVRWRALEWFQGNCEAGTLPWTIHGFSRTKIDGKGYIGRPSGSSMVVEPFPLSDFTYTDPTKGVAMGLKDDWRMGFGVYCVYVSPTIDVRITCEYDQFRSVGCEGENKVIDLEPGFTWILVDDDLGMADGFYTVQTKCSDGTDTCSAGGVTARAYMPLAVVPVDRDLRALLQDPTVQPPPSYHLTVTMTSYRTNVIPDFDRSEWTHWTDEDGDCQDTRQEVLVAESTELVTYSDDDRCRVATGNWVGAFTWGTFSDPGEMDIDHMVPLANAHRSGGWAWDADRKRSYANDLARDSHLAAVDASANRSKGDRGPEDWKPPVRAIWCDYAKDWVEIKNAWGLTVTTDEADALVKMLQTCTPVVQLNRE